MAVKANLQVFGDRAFVVNVINNEILVPGAAGAGFGFNLQVIFP